MGEPTGTSGLSIRAERYDGPAGTRLIADLTADLTIRYVDEDDPPACARTPEAAAMRLEEVAAEEAAYLAELGPEDVVPPVGTFLVANLDGVPVGCAALRRHDAGIGEVKRVWVDPGARGRGIARALMAHVEAVAVELGYRRIVLETGLRQPEAISLYESLGYRRRAVYGRYRDSPLSVCMERELGSRA